MGGAVWGARGEDEAKEWNWNWSWTFGSADRHLVLCCVWPLQVGPVERVVQRLMLRKGKMNDSVPCHII